MEMWVVHNESEWEEVRPTAAQDGSGKLHKEKPLFYPCIIIQAYAGAGWQEMDFVYLNDFTRKDEEYVNGGWNIRKYNGKYLYYIVDSWLDKSYWTRGKIPIQIQRGFNPYGLAEEPVIYIYPDKEVNGIIQRGHVMAGMWASSPEEARAKLVPFLQDYLANQRTANA
mgnify:CR=1 FL=1